MELDIAAWTLAVALFVAGDWVTTRRGLAREGSIERNPLARRLADRLGLAGAFLLLKGLALAAALAGYQYAAGDPATRPYRLLFPAVVALVGLWTTAHNLRVLAAS